MIHELPVRVSGHVVAFGFLTDPSTGRAMPEAGRCMTYQSADFPKAALPACVPGRVAAHVTGLTLAIAPAHQASGALIVQPVYDWEDGWLAGRHVVALRVALDRTLDRDDMPGEGVYSEAWVFSWEEWSRHHASLLPMLASMRPRRPRVDEPRVKRLAGRRVEVAVTAGVPTPRPAVRAAAEHLLDALARGRVARLTRADCASESEFLAAVGLALAELPPEAAGHVGISVGLDRDDPGLAWTWRDEPPATERVDAEDGAPARPAAVGRRVPARGLGPEGIARRALTACREDDGVGRAMRAAFVADAGSIDLASPHRVATALRCWRDGAAPPPGEAARLLEAIGGFDPAAARATLAATRADPVLEGAARILLDLPSDTAPMSAVALVARVLAAAAVAPGDHAGGAMRRLEAGLGRALPDLARRQPDAALALAASDDDFAAALARAVDHGGSNLRDDLRFALQLAHAGAGLPVQVARRGLARIAPLDSRVLDGWAESDLAAADPSRLLWRLATVDGPPLPDDVVLRLAERALESAGWRRLRDLFARIGAEMATVSDERATVGGLARRLRIAAVVARCLSSASDTTASQFAATPLTR